MTNKPAITAASALMLTLGAVVGALAGDETDGPARTYPGCVRIFDGKTFEGWEADPSTWSIVDGAMRGVGGSSRLAFTKADYGSFRLIFTARMNPVNGDHLGVLFWGDRPGDPSRPRIDNAGWIQFMPPHGAMWVRRPIPAVHREPTHRAQAEGPAADPRRRLESSPR